VEVSAVEVPVDKVVFREDLYPRITHDPQTVQKYAADLDVLPPIEVNQRYELIDGWHRWTAHKKNNVETIRVTITETLSDAQLMELAIERNAAYGLQLSQEDKKAMAVRIYAMEVYKTQEERDEKKAYLAKILSVGERTIRRWTARADKDLKQALRKKAFDMWMACHTQDEIAEAIGYSRQAITKFLNESGFATNGQLADCGKSLNFTDNEETSEDEEEEDKSSGLGRYQLKKQHWYEALHEVDFERPIYNIWKQQEKTKGSGHFGNSEVRWVDNLLYLYTQPFDVVIDPFAGGGSTIDVCRKRLRRYWVSDRIPIIERENDIRKHDLTDGLPKNLPWENVKLVYLDPPYWKQAEGKYSKDPTDLANMDLEKFTLTLAGIINGFAKKLPSGGVIALIIQPTQWNAPDREFTDHIADMLRAVKLPLDMRFSVPYESQQYNAQTVEWAKANKRCLVLTRELVVWRVK
jgi:hypothetical protein